MREQGRKTVRARFKHLQPRKILVWDSTFRFSGPEKQPRIRIFTGLRLRTNERLLRTRVFMTLDFIVSVKCVLKLILLVISRLRLFLEYDPKLGKTHTHKQRAQKNPALLEHPLQIGSLIPFKEGFID